MRKKMPFFFLTFKSWGKESGEKGMIFPVSLRMSFSLRTKGRRGVGSQKKGWGGEIHIA